MSKENILFLGYEVTWTYGIEKNLNVNYINIWSIHT